MTLRNPGEKIYRDLSTTKEAFTIFCDYEASVSEYVCKYGGTVKAECTEDFRGWINTTCPFYTILHMMHTQPNVSVTSINRIMQRVHRLRRDSLIQMDIKVLSHFLS
jgi:hypothetical protein